MQVQQKGVTTAKSAKDYLSKNEIPQLFECLMTGLMYHRPIDHINYLQECLEKIKKQGVNAVHWDMFLESKKTPLPPIVPTPKENFRPEPLPEIGALQLKIDLDSSIIIIQGGPGIGKTEICRKLSSQFPEFCHIGLGLKIRERAALEAADLKSKWSNVAEIINEGDLAPDDFVLEILIKELNKHSDKKNFIIDGYPRTVQERQDFERVIGIDKLKFVVLIDCEEDICQQFLLNKSHNNEWKDYSHVAISKRIANYKSNTLEICKYFDDQGKLKVIDGEKETELSYRDVQHLFNKEIRGLSSPLPPLSDKDSTLPNSSRSNLDIQEQQTIEEIPKLTGISMETERKNDLPQCTFILLLGGPGSGKTETASSICKKYSGWVHLDINEILRTSVMQNDSTYTDIAQRIEEFNPDFYFVESLLVNIDTVRNNLKSLDENTQVVILEGFPKNQVELNKLNTEIGKMDIVILLDCEEDVMKYRLFERFSGYGSVEDNEINSEMRIQYFKENGLPLCRYYDEKCHLNIVNSDKDKSYVIGEIENITSSLIKNANNSALLNEENSLQADNEIVYEDVASTAAVTIQASIRGHLTRKRLKETRDSNARGVRTASQTELMNANIILLIGGPGSGKKSLGDHLVIKYAMSFIHVDQLISNEINSNSEQADALNQCIESNFEDITPILALLRKVLVNSLSVSKTITVAGFPKTIEQYRLFVDKVAAVSAIIYLDVDSETMQSRLESEVDPDFATNVTDLIQEFNEKNPSFIEELSTMSIFNKISGVGSIEDVLAEASVIIDTFSFIKTEE